MNHDSAEFRQLVNFSSDLLKMHKMRKYDQFYFAQVSFTHNNKIDIKKNMNVEITFS